MIIYLMIILVYLFCGLLSSFLSGLLDENAFEETYVLAFAFGPFSLIIGLVLFVGDLGRKIRLKK